MKSKKELQWIIEGYNRFSQHGPHSLNIEAIARKINKNKSSFYHYFGDIEVFETELLEFHVQLAEELAQLARNCKTMKPDVLNLFADRKIDIFFHKQLRMNRDNPKYKKCYEKAFKKVELAIIDKWAEVLGLNKQPLFAGTFLNLIIENFLLRITEHTFNYQWLNNYLEEVHAILKQMNTNPEK